MVRLTSQRRWLALPWPSRVTSLALFRKVSLKGRYFNEHPVLHVEVMFTGFGPQTKLPTPNTFCLTEQEYNHDMLKMAFSGVAMLTQHLPHKWAPLFKLTLVVLLS